VRQNCVDVISVVCGGKLGLEQIMVSCVVRYYDHVILFGMVDSVWTFVMRFVDAVRCFGYS
jgi:hypothetical protein